MTPRPAFLKHITIHAPYRLAWVYLSNAAVFPDLFPHWIRDIEPLSATVCMATSSNDDSLKLQLSLEKEFGVIDIESHNTNGVIEHTHTRLLNTGDSRCAFIWLTHCETVSDAQWATRTANIEQDLANIKHTLESDFQQNA